MDIASYDCYRIKGSNSTLEKNWTNGFDLYEYDMGEMAYLKERLTQAHQNAAK